MPVPAGDRPATWPTLATEAAGETGIRTFGGLNELSVEVTVIIDALECREPGASMRSNGPSPATEPPEMAALPRPPLVHHFTLELWTRPLRNSRPARRACVTGTKVSAVASHPCGTRRHLRHRGGTGRQARDSSATRAARPAATAPGTSIRRTDGESSRIGAKESAALAYWWRGSRWPPPPRLGQSGLEGFQFADYILRALLAESPRPVVSSRRRPW